MMMLGHMSTREIERLRQVVGGCYNASELIGKIKFLRDFNAGVPIDLDDSLRAVCLLSAGCVLGRIEKAIGGEEESAPSGASMDRLQDIISANKGNLEKTIDALFEYITTVTDEAFRYGYYAALEYENVEM